MKSINFSARHIEPRQVATYESTKYQDILDDLVMFTDQDVLSHAQAEAASDPSIISADFTLALIEATNAVMKDANIQVLDSITNVFSEVQYLYPDEHEQELIQQQIEQISQDQILNVDEQRSMVILQELQSELITDIELTKTTVDETTTNSTINDLSSLLQMDSCLVSPEKTTTSETTTIAITTTEEAIETAVSSESVTTDLVTPVRPTKTINHITIAGSPTREVLQIDYDTLLPPEVPVQKITPLFDHSTIASYSPISRGPGLQSMENIPELQTTVSKSSIVFETRPSPPASKSPMMRESQEIIIDSGCLKQFESEEMHSPCQPVDIEDLLFDKPIDPYDLIEQHAITSSTVDPKTNENDQLMEDIPSMNEHSKEIPTFVRTYHRYQEKYLLKLQRDKEKSMKKSQEKSLTIPSVKLKLHSICGSHKISKKKSKRKFPTYFPKQAPISPPSSPKMTTPVTITNAETICPPIDIKQDIDKPEERPRLKITIRTKLPPPPPASSLASEPNAELKQSTVTVSAIATTAVKSTKEKQEVIKSRKNKKKHHHSHLNQQSKKKTLVNQSETEYAGLTRFERPLAEMYHQQTVPVSEDAVQKAEANSPSTPSVSSNELTLLDKPVVPHSGFMIDEQTPPSSITSMEHRNSAPPLPSTTQPKIETQISNNNYSHIFDYDNAQDQTNNNTFITPPPDIDLYPQHLKMHSLENIFSQSNSPHENILSKRKSSVASSASSKSLPTINYAIDAEALEPVSPTPIASAPSLSTATKTKHSQKTPLSVSSTSSSITVGSSNYRDPSSNCVDHHQHSNGHSQPFQHQQQSHAQHKSSKEHHSSSKKSSSSSRSSKSDSSQNYPSSRSMTNHNYRSSQETSTTPPSLPTTITPPSSSFHLNPYATPYHHFAARTGPSAAFYNFPLPNPYLNHHTALPPTHFHHPHHSMKYHHHNHHGTHSYPTHHQSSFSYHPHLPRQQQYHGSNYMCK